MKVLVTGGAGFIGSHIVDGLIKEGHDVVVLDDLSSGKEKHINVKAVFYKIDIRDVKISEIFRKEAPDFVSHQAAQKDVRVSVSDPIFDAQVNILGTINLLQNCVKYDVKRVIFASTGGAIYGEQEVFPAPETHPLRPISPYGITKLVAEKYLYYYRTIYGLEYTSLRYSNVYGPRQDPYGEAGVVAIFVKKMINDEQPIINGDGEQTRDFVYVGDIVKANIQAMKNNATNNIFNIGTGREISVNQLFNHLREIINPSMNARHGPPQEGEQRRSVIDYSRAKEVLHWQPEVSLLEGFKNTFEYFKNND